MPSKQSKLCRWTTQSEALSAFATFKGKTESASHIKPLHWYVAGRLVLEGGFDPSEITPHPPFRVQPRSGKPPKLHFDLTKAGGGESTILGGLKTKSVDVVVAKAGIGPVLAVSCKGVTRAFRNLTNRMEETIGECTNLHITYPALVLGYLVLLRGNRRVDSLLEHVAAKEGSPASKLNANDIAIAEGGEPVEGIMRFHNALRELIGRRGIRDDVSRYEAIGFGLVEMLAASPGALLANYPGADSPLRLENFFTTLYLRYDERFVTSAPNLSKRTKRQEWASDSPAFKEIAPDYEPRIAGG